MKKEIPSRIIEVCDICNREEKILYKCIVCGKDYCMLCEAIIAGCIHKVTICKNCSKDEYVKEVISKYAKMLSFVLDDRDKELKNWGINENVKDKTEQS